MKQVFCKFEIKLAKSMTRTTTNTSFITLWS